MGRKSLKAVVVFLMLSAVVLLSGRKAAFASSGSIEVDKIDYDKDTLTIKVTENDKMVLFANSPTASTWDIVYGEINNGTITMDISWASKTKNVVFYIKGDSADTPVKVTLPKQPTGMSVSLNTGEVKFLNLGGTEVVWWRKSGSEKWNKLDLSDNDNGSKNAFQKEIESFMLQGITLYFKTGQTQGSSTDAGIRPSKEVSLKIAKRAAAPSVKIDYSKLSISVTNKMEYKKSSDSTWTEIKDNYLNIGEVDSNLLYTNYNIAAVSNEGSDIDDISVDIRIRATQSKVASAITTIVIPVQEGLPGEGKNIKYGASGSAQFRFAIVDCNEEADGIDIKGASTSNPYEYTIVKDGKEINLQTASWKSVTSTNEVMISITEAPEGSNLYIRKKAASNKPASSYCVIPIVNYLDASTIRENAELTKIKGLNKESDILFFDVIVPKDNVTISSIAFGVKTAQFSQSTACLVDGKYVINVTLTDLSEVEAVASNIGTDLKAVITLSNNDKINDGVSLFIRPAASVTGENVVIYKGIQYDNEVKLLVNLGDVVKKNEGINATKVSINGKDIVLGAGDQTLGDGEYSINIIMPASAIKQYVDELALNQIGNPHNFIVELSNGEKITSKVTITVKSAASLTSSSTGIGISASAYEEVPYENPKLELTIDSSIYSQDNSYYVSAVMWEGVNILKRWTADKNVVTIELDLGKVVNGSNSLTGLISINLKAGDINNELMISTNYRITVAR